MLRAPKCEPVRLPDEWFHNSRGPAFGRIPVRAEDADLTRQHRSDPLGERIILTGRVLDSDAAFGLNHALSAPAELPDSERYAAWQQ